MVIGGCTVVVGGNPGPGDRGPVVTGGGGIAIGGCAVVDEGSCGPFVTCGGGMVTGGCTVVVVGDGACTVDGGVGCGPDLLGG